MFYPNWLNSICFPPSQKKEEKSSHLGLLKRYTFRLHIHSIEMELELADYNGWSWNITHLLYLNGWALSLYKIEIKHQIWYVEREALNVERWRCILSLIGSRDIWNVAGQYRMKATQWELITKKKKEEKIKYLSSSASIGKRETSNFCSFLSLDSNEIHNNNNNQCRSAWRSFMSEKVDVI